MYKIIFTKAFKFFLEYKTLSVTRAYKASKFVKRVRRTYFYLNKIPTPKV